MDEVVNPYVVRSELHGHRGSRGCINRVLIDKWVECFGESPEEIKSRAGRRASNLRTFFMRKRVSVCARGRSGIRIFL